MDYYILIFGTKKDILLLTRQLTKTTDEECGYDAEVIFKSYASFFWFYASQSLYAANQKCNRHLLHLTQQFEYRGLSRVGRQLGSFLESSRRFEIRI